MSFVRAHIMITAIKKRNEAGYAPYWMVDKLVSLGVDRKRARKLIKEDASRLLDDIRGIVRQPEMF